MFVGLFGGGGGDIGKGLGRLYVCEVQVRMAVFSFVFPIR